MTDPIQHGVVSKSSLYIQNNLSMPPKLEPDQFLSEVTKVLESGTKQNYTTEFMTDQIYELTQKNPKLTTKLGFPENYLDIKQKIVVAYKEKGLLKELKDGTKIEQKIFTNLEHGDLKEAKAIVLHQTDSSSAESTLEYWETGSKGKGAHFLIDKDGTIYQTANLDKKAWHVGNIKSRCYAEKNCSKNETKFIEKNVRWNNSAKLNETEIKKPYPERYPTNSESIGIEVVGMYKKGVGYEKITEAQKKSLDKLVSALQEKYNLTNKDIYAHTNISNKDEELTEGTDMGY